MAQALRAFLEKTGFAPFAQDLVFKFLVLWLIAISLIVGYLAIKTALLVYWGIEIHWLWWLWGGTVLD